MRVLNFPLRMYIDVLAEVLFLIIWSFLRGFIFPYGFFLLFRWISSLLFVRGNLILLSTSPVNPGISSRHSIVFNGAVHPAKKGAKGESTGRHPDVGAIQRSRIIGGWSLEVLWREQCQPWEAGEVFFRHDCGWRGERRWDEITRPLSRLPF